MPGSRHFSTLRQPLLELGDGWDGSFDTAGAVVAVDVDQLPYVCRSWATVESFAAIAGAEGGVALFSPDAPLGQFGYFHFGPPLDLLPRPANPSLLAWAYNNYWDTNFARVESSRAVSGSATASLRLASIRTWPASATMPAGSHRRR